MLASAAITPRILSGLPVSRITLENALTVEPPNSMIDAAKSYFSRTWSGFVTDD
jgi:hypothetical protein